MLPETTHAIFERLFAALDDPGHGVPHGTTVLDLGRYFRPEELAREEAVLFRRRPIVIAHASELLEHGSWVAEDVGKTPLVVVRDGERIRAFVNACRHRGARLVCGERGSSRVLTCPYHAWSYQLDGTLSRVPHEEVFGALDRASLGLVEVRTQVRHGFVWACLDSTAPLDVAAFLGPMLDQDFAAFGLERHVVLGRTRRVKRANWKLVVDAFAEGYHLSSLHARSLARFFLETSILDDCAPHVRQVGARKSIREARDPACWDLRAHTTVFYDVFPNTVLVFHPDWLSALTVLPDGVDRVRVVHRMLAADAPTSDAARAKLEQSFAHIDEQVFEKEDLAIAESIQSTLESGAVQTMALGGMEEGMRLFHAARDAALASG